MARGNGVRVNGTARHPIGVVSERTGLTPDVLRVWERRYGVVEPERSEGGQRLYTDADIERLRLLHLATLAGRAIGQVAELNTAELSELLREDEAERARAPRRGTAPDPSDYVGRALEPVRALDAEGLESLLRRAAAVLGVRVFLEDVAAPLFREIGEEWHAGRLSPAQEHVATVVIRRVLDGVMGLFSPRDDAPLLLVATPSGDRHEVGALLVAASALGSGWNVVYLGADLPASEVVVAARSKRARAVAVSAVLAGNGDGRGLVTELSELRRGLPAHVPVVVGGAGVARREAELSAEGLVVVGDLGGLAPVLEGLDDAPARP